MKKNLEIQLGSNYQIVVETDISKIIESPFLNVYKKAFELVDEIIDYSKDQKSSINDNKTCNIPYTYNNVIAFTGDRGIGKTSAMVSFANMLAGGKESSQIRSDKVVNSYIDKKSFYLTKVVDPSLFNQNSNIMEVVISHLFSHMIEELKDEKCNKKDSYKSTAISAFQEVFKNIKTTLKTKSEVYNSDSVEALIDLAGASDLQKNVNILVTAFLEFVNKEYLVIQIDDIDLHTQQAHEMAEMIRKYLTQPNVIVLMALNPEQLEEVVFQQFINDYNGILSTYDNESYEKKQKISEIRNMTTRYMEKFLPLDRRIYLPTLYELSFETGIILMKGKNVYCVRSSVSELIMELIYIKTGLITFESEKLSYLFMPKNLRELIYEIEKLYNMRTIVFTSFVQNLRARKYLGLDINEKNYNELVNEDGIARWVEFYTDNSKGEYENTKKYNPNSVLLKPIQITEWSMDILGLLKLRKASKEFWDADVIEIEEILVDNEQNKVSTIFFEGFLKNTFAWHELDNEKIDISKFETNSSVRNNYDKFVNYVLGIDGLDIDFVRNINNKQLSELKMMFLNWAKDNFDYDKYDIFREFFSINLESKNRFIINRLCIDIDKALYRTSGVYNRNRENGMTRTNENEEKYDFDFINEDEYQVDLEMFNYDEYNRIKYMGNNVLNISYGDVNYILKLYQQMFINSQATKLVYAIRLSYNIQIQDFQNNSNFENKTYAKTVMLLGGSLYNPIVQKVIRDRPKNGKFDNFYHRYVTKTRNFTIEEKSLNYKFYLLGRDFAPASKVRRFYKFSMDLKSLMIYFDHYRELETVFYDLDKPTNSKRIILDVWSFMFNLHRVEDFRKMGWLVEDLYIDDIKFDFYHLTNVLMMSQLDAYASSFSKESIPDALDNDLINYAGYLDKIRSVITFDFPKIHYNNFRYLNYLKGFEKLKNNLITEHEIKQESNESNLLISKQNASIIYDTHKDFNRFLDNEKLRLTEKIKEEKELFPKSVTALNKLILSVNINNKTRLATLINVNNKTSNSSGYIVSWSKNSEIELDSLTELVGLLRYMLTNEAYNTSYNSTVKNFILAVLGTYKNE